MKNIFQFAKEIFSAWNRDKALTLGAALSYYTVFSLPPLLTVIIAVAGLAFGHQMAQEEIVAQIQGLVGPQSAGVIHAMIEGAYQHKGASILATSFGVVVLLMSATGAFGQLQYSLNVIFRLEPKPDAGIKTTITSRLISLGLVVSIGFLLIVSLAVSAGLAAMGKVLAGLMTGAWLLEVLLHVANFLISFMVITVLFALVFKVLPDGRIPWRSISMGAAVTSFLFTIGKFLIGLYLGKSRIGSQYGAAGSLVLILVWVYYSSQILFLGAEFIKVYMKRKGQKVVPKEYTRLREDKKSPPA
jgi:membrane protein